MAINFPNDPSTNPGNGGQWTDPGGSGTWEVEIINGEAIWTLVSNDSGGGSGGAVSLNELNDVTLSSPTDKNVLQYNQATNQWINAPAPAAANVNLNDLGDVDTTGGTEGDVLVKQSNGNWEAQTPANDAGIGEAPEDGTPYVRQDASWISMPDNGGGATLNIDEAPADGVAYTRKDNSWVPGVEAVSGSTAQIEGDNNIDTGTNTRAVATGQVLTYDGTKFAPAALPADNVGIGEAPNDGKQYGRQSEGWTEITASGGGGGGVEEAPEDGSLYARRDAGWVNLEQTGGLVYGKLSTSGLDAVTNYETTTAATTDGFTQVTLGSDTDDGNTAVQLPAGWTNSTWFDEKDPDTTTAGYQTIWVNGNGFASFMPTAIATQVIDNNSYPNFNGYDPVNSFMEAQNLLFGFHNMDSALDMVCTKEVGDYFVIHIQWKDEYGYFFDTAGGAAASGYSLPFNAYNPDLGGGGEAKKRAKPKTVATQLFTGELWLNKNGSVRMAYGPSASAISMVEESVAAGFSQQSAGIYKLGVPVAEVMGTAIDFKAFASNNLVYGLDQTNDGNNVSGPGDLLDWYIDYSKAAVPFLTDAPEDGKTYGRQDGAWVEAAAGGGGGGSSDASGLIPSHVEQQGRLVATGIHNIYPINQFRSSDPRADEFGDVGYVRPANKPASAFAWGTSGSAGTWQITDDGTEKVLNLHVEDFNGFEVFGANWNGPSDLLELVDATSYSFDGSLQNPFNSNLNPNVFLFCTVRFWRNTPGAAVEWQYISVDTWIPLKYSGSPSGSAAYKKVYIDQQYLGTGEYDVQTVYDYIGASADELSGAHITALGTTPDIIANSGLPQGAVIECYTNPKDLSLTEEGGGGGGGAPAKAAPETAQGRSIGDPDLFANGQNIASRNGMVLVLRDDLANNLNVGSINGGGSGGGGGGGIPARKQLSDEDKRKVLEEKKQKALESLKEIDPKTINDFDKGKRGPNGLGWRIPGFDSKSDDIRWVQDYTLSNINQNTFESSGGLQYDRLGLWDLFGFDSFLQFSVPQPNDTLQWDDIEAYWTTASSIFFRKNGKDATYDPQVEKAKEIIAAVQSNPELKAALKAALAD